MRTTLHRFTLAALLLPLSLLGLAGCGGGQRGGRTFSEADNVEHDDHHDHAHAHGPHDGHVVEIGGDDYHAEVVLDESTRKLTVYLLGSDLKTPLPVDAESLALRLKVGEETQEIKLAPEAQPEDGEGKASKFVQGEDALPEAIKDAEDLHGEVVVTFGGTQYRGPITHDHAH